MQMNAKMQARLESSLSTSTMSDGEETLDDIAQASAPTTACLESSWSSSQGACPVLADFVRVWHDSLQAHDDRVRLTHPWLPRLCGTRSTREVEERRGWLALDWLVRVRTPAWLDLAPAPDDYALTLSRLQHALRALPQISDLATALVAGAAVSALEADALAIWGVAKAAVGQATRSAAHDAVRASAWGAAWAGWTAIRARSAHDTAWTAASQLAWASAWDSMWAARAAAWGSRGVPCSKAEQAARAYLAPTLQQLQLSALDLMERMAAVVPAQSGRIENAA